MEPSPIRYRISFGTTWRSPRKATPVPNSYTAHHIPCEYHSPACSAHTHPFWRAASLQISDRDTRTRRRGSKRAKRTPCLFVQKQKQRSTCAYQTVGLEPPHIRWFDSPLAFVLEPEPAPQSIETRLRSSLEASIAATIPERISEPIWGKLSYMIERIGTNVWYSTGRLIEKAVQERMGRTTSDMIDAPRSLTRRDLANALWSVATERLWQADNDNALRLGARIADSAQAYENQAGRRGSAVPGAGL